jgi:hypothetical protein
MALLEKAKDKLSLTSQSTLMIQNTGRLVTVIRNLKMKLLSKLKATSTNQAQSTRERFKKGSNMELG